MKEFCRYILESLEKNQVAKAGSGANAGLKRPVYFNHIRKTAGTSVYMSLIESMSFSVSKCLDDVYHKKTHRYISDRGIVVGYNKRLIQKSNYDFAFSHLPLWSLSLPDNLYVFTVFRDPAARVISYYNYLNNLLESGSKHICLKEEGEWAEGSFSDFLELTPKKHLLAQIYNFSRDCDVGDAVKQAQRLNKYFCLEDLNSGMDNVFADLGLKGKIGKKNASESKNNINNQEDINTLMDILEPEYLFLSDLGITY